MIFEHYPRGSFNFQQIGKFGLKTLQFFVKVDVFVSVYKFNVLARYELKIFFGNFVKLQTT